MGKRWNNEKFQFHYGSVKSNMINLVEMFAGEFQFHYGSVKSEKIIFNYDLFKKFQFHYGSVKRWFRKGNL